MDKEDLKNFLYVSMVIVISIILVALVPIQVYDKQQFNRNMECLKIGRNYVYENNSWVCK